MKPKGWKTKHNGSITDSKGYRWLYDVVDANGDVVATGLECSVAKLIAAVPALLVACKETREALKAIYDCAPSELVATVRDLDCWPLADLNKVIEQAESEK